MSTPMHPSSSSEKDENGKYVSEKEYLGMIDSLHYLTAKEENLTVVIIREFDLLHNQIGAVEKRRKRNEERHAPQDEQPQQNLMFDAEQDEQPQHDHVFYDEHDQQQQQFDDEHGQQHQPEEPMFPGGPYDLSVLTDYEHHIAINAWNGQERRVLKVVSNGKKQDKFIDIIYHLPAQIDHWINISGLRPLRRYSLHMIDGNMISAFAERCTQRLVHFTCHSVK
uniref:Uncharacterized protein LOC113787001 n=1 Tax=Cicer arietinum TaxID=3827 RepID=A0A3Q7XC15_CICAR|nr:uncharacterized protein LOC113787001 [Cicer arietinum]